MPNTPQMVSQQPRNLQANQAQLVMEQQTHQLNQKGVEVKDSKGGEVVNDNEKDLPVEARNINFLVFRLNNLMNKYEMLKIENVEEHDSIKSKLMELEEEFGKKFEELGKVVETLNNIIKEMNSRLPEHINREIESRLSIVNQQVSELSFRVAENKQETSNLSSKIYEVSQQLNELLSRIDEINKRLDEIEYEVEHLKFIKELPNDLVKPQVTFSFIIDVETNQEVEEDEVSRFLEELEKNPEKVMELLGDSDEYKINKKLIQSYEQITNTVFKVGETNLDTELEIDTDINREQLEEIIEELQDFLI